ncbi:hypothetical protein AG0111_0g7878 [Alternaria gaisen]|uniref:Uncharacterized protein n=1 Tax=Alternaria gaisen TaxID=167740 RepID=A0ACB6FHK1_9PLEO|nr:hypothetical protein AG0111_0g7878 [Alternaria gaisen]
MTVFYIPVKDTMFYPKNKKTEKVLFSRIKSPTFGQFSGEAFADEPWNINTLAFSKKT